MLEVLGTYGGEALFLGTDYVFIAFTPQSTLTLIGWLIGWLFCFTAYQPFSGYLTLN